MTNDIPAAARREFDRLLSGGCWVKTRDFIAACRRHGLTFGHAAEVLQIAESDYGGFVCLPGPRTPLCAPDEARNGPAIWPRNGGYGRPRKTRLKRSCRIA